MHAIVMRYARERTNTRETLAFTDVYAEIMYQVGVLCSCSGARSHIALGLAGSAAYSGTKAAIELVSDVLRMELAPWDISVSLVEPGSVALVDCS
jgi:short-subunit dehydrogenase